MPNYVEQRDGGYYLAETRISLDSVVLPFKDGESPESILSAFPPAGSLVRVYGAIIFYLENQDTVDAWLSEQDRLWSELSSKESVPPESLAARFREARGQVIPRPA